MSRATRAVYRQYNLSRRSRWRLSFLIWQEQIRRYRRLRRSPGNTGCDIPGTVKIDGALYHETSAKQWHG